MMKASAAVEPSPSWPNEGVRVQLLTATRGQAGSRGDPPLCSPEELPDVRASELRCACQALGILPPILLDYEDGHLSETDPEVVTAKIQAAAEANRRPGDYSAMDQMGFPATLITSRLAA